MLHKKVFYYEEKMLAMLKSMKFQDELLNHRLLLDSNSSATKRIIQKDVKNLTTKLIFSPSLILILNILKRTIILSLIF